MLQYYKDKYKGKEVIFDMIFSVDHDYKGMVRVNGSSEVRNYLRGGLFTKKAQNIGNIIILQDIPEYEKYTKVYIARDNNNTLGLYNDPERNNDGIWRPTQSFRSGINWYLELPKEMPEFRDIRMDTLYSCRLLILDKKGNIIDYNEL